MSLYELRLSENLNARSEEEVHTRQPGEGLGPGGGAPPLTPYISPKPGGGGGKSFDLDC